MSFFSRFRKAPPAPVPATRPETPAPVASAPTAPDPKVLAAREEESVRTAIAAADLTALARFVTEGSSTRIRQLAAEAIDDPEQIRKLIRSARGGNDKNVYKILTRKRDAFLAHERELEQQQADIAAASADIERHSRRPYDALFTPTLDQFEARWNAVAAHADSTVACTTRSAIDRAREVIAQHLRETAAQASRELVAAHAQAAAREQREREEREASEAAAERKRIEDEERKARSEKLDREGQALGQIGGLLRKAHGALAAGSSKTAAGMRRAIEEKLVTAPPLPAHLANSLKQLDARLEELKDWKRFSVAPKRIDLIERMESLIGASLHPTAIAGHIKDLQEQWRTLSKGAGEDAEADWQRFHAASQKAFQPCREFYDAQDQQKKENLQQRELLFERLLAFEQRQNWEDPDWRTVMTAVREARQLWRQHSPVDPVAAEALQARFSDLVNTLQSRLDAEHSRNVKARQSLVAQARGLLASSDVRAAIDEVKQLQERWKAIGPVPRDEDRRLWEEFRQQCDALFEKRHGEVASRSAALEANRTRASELCDEVERIAALTDQELFDAAKQLPDLRQVFESIEELPKANARQLQDRFDRAVARCKQAIAQQQSRDVERAWTAVLDAADQIRAYRLAVVRGDDAAAVEALRQTADARLSIDRAPKGAVDALKNALAQNEHGDPAANASALRLLCIRAEILTDTPSPAEDHSLRREYQLQRLVQGMGRGGGEAQHLDGLMLEWMAAGPVDDAAYTPLVERIKACRQHAHDKQDASRRKH